ncbi:hypothetical protein U9M48_007443 [Paspalum notatum var. saurae]|uniref:BED-type domain-containing protein n=1 Tax=Paspalum notatum var. saurae TaxID=547442 RepID=A0AAQ3PUI7_PASNO
MERRYDPTFTNHELVLMGVVSDDEDDGEAGRDDLLGETPDAPIDVGDEPERFQPDTNREPGGAAATASTTKSTGRKRKSTSPVWEDMDEIFETVNGVQVRVAARCHYCKKELSARSSCGTGHLSRHAEKCKPRHGIGRAGHQSMLRFNADERISTVLGEYGLTDKVFSITLDNASSNSTAMDTLKPLLSGYVGHLLMHQRCGCHIINLFVKSAFDVLKPYLDDFRTAISFLNSSNQRIAAYKSFCIAMSVRPRKFSLDMDVRWNSTYLMLKHLIPYKSTFVVSYRPTTPKGKRKYDDKFGGAKLQRASNSTPGEGTGNSGIANAPGLGANRMNLSSNPSLLSRRTSASALLHAASTNAGIAGTELSSYLDSDTVQKFDDDFDFLDWWRDRKITYPVLSILAKDILSVPVSTVSSESAFSLVSRVIEERRRRLAPSIVEMLSLVKDWEEADARMQHTAENKATLEAFEELFLDGDQI